LPVPVVGVVVGVLGVVAGVLTTGGVTAFSGIFGTFVFRPGSGVVVLAAGGTTGVVVTAAAGGVTCATVFVTIGAWRVFLLSAAYAAAPAPSTSTAVAASTIASGRQPRAATLPRAPAPAPHCRHQS